MLAPYHADITWRISRGSNSRRTPVADTGIAVQNNDLRGPSDA